MGHLTGIRVLHIHTFILRYEEPFEKWNVCGIFSMNYTVPGSSSSCSVLTQHQFCTASLYIFDQKCVPFVCTVYTFQVYSKYTVTLSTYRYGNGSWITTIIPSPGHSKEKKSSQSAKVIYNERSTKSEQKNLKLHTLNSKRLINELIKLSLWHICFWMFIKGIIFPQMEKCSPLLKCLSI